MRGLPEAEPGPHTRTRRWDTVILGSALPGLVAAVRLGMRGARVLVLEEEAAARAFHGRREPFWMGGTSRGGVLGACLRALGVPLIDQRRIETDPLAFQVALPTARLDVGQPDLCADEWVAWGLAKPEAARSLAAALAAAAAAEAQALLEAPWLRTRLRRRAASPSVDPAPAAPGPRRPRGLPAALRDAPPRLAYVLAAQTRALSHCGARELGDEERARLLGAPLEGGAVMRGAEAGLRAILRRRIETLYGEFRSIASPFRLLSVRQQPGVAPDAAGESGELWVGRAFVLNAPRAALAAAAAQDPVPEPLCEPPPRLRRVCLHLRTERENLPDAMASRVIIVGDEAQPPEGTNVVALRRFPPGAGGEAVDLLACAVIDAGDADVASREAEIAARVASLLPFAGRRLVRVPAPEPRWDDDAWLGEPAAGAVWPAELEVRLPTRQPIYHLDRAAVGGLGYEGELMLGWRAGDAIAADLA